MHTKIVVIVAGCLASLLTIDVASAGDVPAVVPEPATLSLLAGGLGVLIAARWLRRNKD